MAQVGRRAVLGSGVLAGSAALVGGSARAEPALKPGDWASVRAQFKLSKRLLHFAAFTFASHPTPVRAAIERHRAGLDADTHGYSEAKDRTTPVLKAAAQYLGGTHTQIALTDSTTMGLAVLYGGLKLEPGQDVLTTEHDFLSTHETLRLRAERDGTVVRKVTLYDDPAKASAADMVARLKAGLKPRTRIVAVTWVHSWTGVKLPVKEIAAMLAEVNRSRPPKDHALLCVDGVHGFGAENATAVDLGCDFLVSGTHKWLFGPRGTGLIWGKESAWPAVRPLYTSFSSEAFEGWNTGTPSAGPPAVLATPGGFTCAEHRWAVAEAFAFHAAIGKARIAARTRDQATRLKKGLAEIPKVRVVTPTAPELSSGIVCCDVDGMGPGQLFQLVGKLHDEHGIVASTSPYRRPYLRFGPSIVTTPEQVDVLVKTMAKLV